MKHVDIDLMPVKREYDDDKNLPSLLNFSDTHNDEDDLIMSDSGEEFK
jgi:hypothetical protein